MKILIISHNPISPQSNMGKTFLSLFSAFEKQELCQLYIYPTIPNVDRCASYYRVTDKEILKSLICFRKAGGEVDKGRICEFAGVYENAGDEALYRSRKNKKPLRRLLRDAMWGMARWYHSDMKTWLVKEQPECIFVAPGVAKFLYNIAITIAEDLGIPIVTYICDEYYFVKTPRGLTDALRLKLLKSKMEALMERSAHLLVISDELRQAYSEKFGLEATVLMTGAGIPVAEKASAVSEPCEICYFGNIRCNRYLSLCDVGRELDAINKTLGREYKLKIYTAEKDEQILKELSQYCSIELCGFVTGQAFEEAFQHSQLLLHVEAFDEESIDFVQHSVSTKIADSLASGIPLLAYGPERISSMRHLLRHECAITAASKDKLGNMLLTAFTSETVRTEVVRNALKTANACHDSKNAGLQLRKTVIEVISNAQK